MATQKVMQKIKSWVSVQPPLFEVGRIEFHTNPKKMLKRMNKAGASYNDDYLDDCSGVVVYEGLAASGTLYVGVFNQCSSTLAHEIFHAAVRYLAWVGVPLEHDSGNETYAYLIGWLTEQFSPVLKQAQSTAQQSPL